MDFEVNDLSTIYKLKIILWQLLKSVQKIAYSALFRTFISIKGGFVIILYQGLEKYLTGFKLTYSLSFMCEMGKSLFSFIL